MAIISSAQFHRSSAALFTVNPAFFREIKESSEPLWRLLGEAQRACTRPVRTFERGEHVLDILNRLREELRTYFRLEEFYGYFENPAYAESEICDRADGLRCEHEQLEAELERIIAVGHNLLERRYYSSFSLLISQRFSAFNAHFQEHEAHENELIFDVFVSTMVAA